MTDELLERQCASCGKAILIEVEEDGSYEGGHYWGAMKIPTDEAEVVERETNDKGQEVVRWSEYKEVEYWQCEDCHDEQ